MTAKEKALIRSILIDHALLMQERIIEQEAAIPGFLRDSAAAMQLHRTVDALMVLGWESPT